MTSTIIISSKFHGGRHFKTQSSYPQSGVAPNFWNKNVRVERNVGAPQGLPRLDPTKQVPQRAAPYYQDFERQIEAARRKEAIEASESKPVKLLEREEQESDETAITETTPQTALMDLETDPFTSPSELKFFSPFSF